MLNCDKWLLSWSYPLYRTELHTEPELFLLKYLSNNVFAIIINLFGSKTKSFLCLTKMMITFCFVYIFQHSPTVKHPAIFRKHFQTRFLFSGLMSEMNFYSSFPSKCHKYVKNSFENISTSFLPTLTNKILVSINFWNLRYLCFSILPRIRAYCFYMRFAPGNFLLNVAFSLNRIFTQIKI